MAACACREGFAVAATHVTRERRYGKEIALRGEVEMVIGNGDDRKKEILKHLETLKMGWSDVNLQTVKACPPAQVLIPDPLPMHTCACKSRPRIMTQDRV